MNRRLFLSVVLAAFIIGVATAYVTAPSGEKCKKIEEQVQQSRNFTGTISCYPPGVIKVNLSSKVEENSQLKCVCRGVQHGRIKIFPITVAG
ncbi:MAG: hypothetical protein ABEJ98_02290 [Candidatus Nanohaloarchaea archaeon]